MSTFRNKFVPLFSLIFIFTSFILNGCSEDKTPINNTPDKKLEVNIKQPKFDADKKQPEIKIEEKPKNPLDF